MDNKIRSKTAQKQLENCFPGWNFLCWIGSNRIAWIKKIDYLSRGWKNTKNVRFLVILPDGGEESWHLTRVLPVNELGTSM